MDLSDPQLKAPRGGSAKPLLRITAQGTSGQLLSAYPWTNAGDVHPGGIGFVHVAEDAAYSELDPPYLFPDRHRIYNGIIRGAITGNIDPAKPPTVWAVAITTVNLARPMRMARFKYQNTRVDQKMDFSFFYRMPVGSPPDYIFLDAYGMPEYHNVQILRNQGYPNQSSPAMHMLNLWGENTAPSTLIGQTLLWSEVPWAPGTVYTAYDNNPRVGGGLTIGHAVKAISAGATSYFYVCRTSGTSHATTEPTWPTTVGATVNDNGVTWECFARVNYQAAPVQFEMTDNGTQIVAKFGTAIATGVITTHPTNTRIGLSTYYSSADSQISDLEIF